MSTGASQDAGRTEQRCEQVGSTLQKISNGLSLSVPPWTPFIIIIILSQALGMITTSYIQGKYY